MQRREDPEKYCDQCGKRLKRKHYGKRIEDFVVFTKRKYCDIQCYAMALLARKEK